MARFAAFILLLLSTCPALADDGAKLVGIWKLTAFDIEFQQSGKREAGSVAGNPVGI